MSQTTIQKIICPLCKVSISNKDLPKPDIGMNIVAIDHEDHVLIIKYDSNQSIRDVIAKKLYEEKDYEKSDNCPACGIQVPIPKTDSYPTETVYKHGDHIAVVYAFDKNIYVIDSIKLIKLATTSATFTEFSELKIPTDLLAYILTEIAIGKNVIEIPNIMEEDKIMIFLKDHLNIRNIVLKQVNEDKIKIDYDKIQFFKSIIERNRNPVVLSKKIFSGLKIIDKITDLVIQLSEKNRNHPLLEQLLELTEKKGIYKIIKQKLEKINKEKGTSYTF